MRGRIERKWTDPSRGIIFARHRNLDEGEIGIALVINQESRALQTDRSGGIVSMAINEVSRASTIATRD